MTVSLYKLFLYAATCAVAVSAFSIGPLPSSSSSSSLVLLRPRSDVALRSTTDEAAAVNDEAGITAKGLYKRDRYIATNRFSVRRDQQAKFEKRWATRKSKLATLQGFQYFHLMRRVNLVDDATAVYDGGDSDETAFENYVSFTIWNKKSDFSAWRTGEAFKEAHGGTSIGAFVTTMIGSAFVLRGAPRPAFYDGLFLQKTVPSDIPETVAGWRSVEADGLSTLPPECFVSLEKLFVPSGESAKSFEQFWASSNSALGGDVPGFVAQSLMRRDGQAKGHGIKEMSPDEPTYVVATIFQDRASYQAWTQGASEVPLTEYSTGGAPRTVFYEGTLVISSPQGA